MAIQPIPKHGVPGWIKGCGIAAAIGLVILIGLIVVLGVCSANVAKNISQNTGNQKSGACSPQPCANASGWYVFISGVQYDAPSATPAETGNVYVTMNVRFKNDTASEQHANPTEFVLQDSTGVKHSLSYTPTCATWEAVNLAKGSEFGPKCIAFQASKGNDKGLVLTWTSVLRDYTIKLT